MMMVCLRLLEGLTNFISKRWRPHLCSIGPDGTFGFSSIVKAV